MVQIFANTSELTPFYTKDPRGAVAFHPLWRAMPILEPFYTQFEKTYDATPFFFVMMNNYLVPWIVVAAYIAFCFLGPKYMAKREAFGLTKALAGWNLFLSIISGVGAVRVGMHVMYLLSPWGGFAFRDTICRSPQETYADNATGVWCVVFAISKIFELADTVFVVLRKKPLIFLHWYHHASVLLVSWFAYVTLMPALYFMAINYSVHAIMYFYFFLMAINRKPKWFNPMWITVIQISQMFVGVGVISATTYYKYYSAEGCQIDDRMILAVHLMYSTYLYLFVEFFVKRFFGIRSSKGKKGAVASATKVEKAL